MAAPAPRAIDAGATGASALANLEPLYTPQQVAEYLQIDVSTCRRLFQDRPDVLRIGRPERRNGKRQYCTLRIPLSTVERFVGERTR